MDWIRKHPNMVGGAGLVLLAVLGYVYWARWWPTDCQAAAENSRRYLGEESGFSERWCEGALKAYPKRAKPAMLCMQRADNREEVEDDCIPLLDDLTSAAWGGR